MKTNGFFVASLTLVLLALTLQLAAHSQDSRRKHQIAHSIAGPENERGAALVIVALCQRISLRGELNCS